MQIVISRNQFVQIYKSNCTKITIFVAPHLLIKCQEDARSWTGSARKGSFLLGFVIEDRCGHQNPVLLSFKTAFKCRNYIQSTQSASFD